MYLVDFMNAHSDWRERLTCAPYSLTIKEDGEYVLLKYDMSLSNFNLPEVIEARGSIFRYHAETNRWICVCRALDKFFNFSEPYAATNLINWSKGVDVQEKIDGSIIRLWFDNGDWHISTNNTIDAAKAECGDTNFRDLFLSLIPNVHDFFSNLHVRFNYWFELVMPQYNHIVIQYPENRLYYLGARDMTNMEECDAQLNYEWLSYPKHFTYHSLEECVEAAHHMGENEEGYVCVSSTMINGSYLRIKVKGDVYLALHRIRGNGTLTIKRCVEMWQDDTLDDYLALCPEHTSFINDFNVALGQMVLLLHGAYNNTAHIAERAELARELHNNYSPIERAYVFSRRDEHCIDSVDYLKHMRPRMLADFLHPFVRNDSISTTVEDE